MNYYILKDNINHYQDKDYKYWHSLIKEDKKKRIDKMIPERKKESILGEYLLMKGLKDYYHLDYSSINISYNTNHKPYLSEPIYYNISHTHDMVVCVFSSNEIGVDIETIKPVNKTTLKSYTHESERAMIHNDTLAIAFYTLKEAYIKMQGLNINHLLDSKFTITNNKPQCITDNINTYMNIYDTYIISICIKRNYLNK